MSTGALVEVRGLPQAIGHFETLAKRLGDLTPVMEAIGALVESQTRTRITSGEGRGPDGEQWPAWSPNYAKTRKGGKGLLNGAGHLVDSIIHEANAGQAVIGSNLEYAAIHQFGGLDTMAPGPAAVPARPYLGLSQDDEEAVMAKIEAFVFGALSQVGVA